MCGPLLIPERDQGQASNLINSSSLLFRGYMGHMGYRGSRGVGGVI